MQAQKPICVAVAATLLMIGCAANQPEIDAQRQQLVEQKKKIDELQNQLDGLKRSVDWDESTRNWDAIAYLTPGSAGFAPIRTSFGTVTVSLENVQAYANGSRITLEFGNVTTATLNQSSVTIDWGSVDTKGSPLNDEQKTQEVKIDKPLRPGTWTNVAVVLEGTPPDKVGFVRIKNFETKQIMLTMTR